MQKNMKGDIEIFGEIFDRNKISKCCLIRDCKLRDFKIKLSIEELEQQIPNLDIIIDHLSTQKPCWDYCDEYDTRYELYSQLDKILPHLIEHKDNEYIRATHHVFYF